MRKLGDCRIASCTQTVREVLVALRAPGRRSGAIMVIDPQNVLRGIFTDSDLARLFEARRDAALDEPIRHVMTKEPRTIPRGCMLADAVEIMAERKISELPVVDDHGAATRPARHYRCCRPISPNGYGRKVFVTGNTAHAAPQKSRLLRSATHHKP